MEVLTQRTIRRGVRSKIEDIPPNTVVDMPDAEAAPLIECGAAVAIAKEQKVTEGGGPES